MTHIDMRPRSATEIIDASFRTLRQNYSKFITAAAILYVPQLVLQLLTPPAPENAGPLTVFTTLSIVFVRGLLFGISSATMIVLTSQLVTRGEMDVNAAIRRTLNRFGTIIIASIITYLIVGVGFIFFIIPGFYLFAKYGISNAIATVEDLGGVESVRRAGVLSEHNRERYLKTMLLMFLLYFIAVGAFSAAAGIMGSQILLDVSSAITNIFLGPVLGISNALIYYDMRVRNEGYDLQLMSERLAADNAPPVGAIA